MADIYNNTKATNANSNLADAQAMKTLEETNNIPQQIKNETTTALANKINANANATNAKTNVSSAKTGILGKWIGTENTKQTWKAGGNLIRKILD